MNVHYTFPIAAFIALPFAIACGSPQQQGSDELADGTSRAASDPMPETPSVLLEAYSPEDADALSKQLFEMGVDLADLRVEGDDITAEGDMVFSAKDLLGDSEPNIEKGYRANVSSNNQRFPMVSQNRLKTIKLVINTTLISNWIGAVRAAATAWSSTGIVNISESNSGDRVTLSFARLGCGSTPESCPIAATTLPVGGHVGASIKINTDNTTVRSNSEANRTMLHEMGHALGFMHPSEGSYIGGTARFSPYPTVMSRSIGGVASSLTSDDLLSLQRMYAPTSQAEYCNALGLVICVNTGDCVSPIDLGPLGCND